MEAMEISKTGLEVEWQRLQIIAQNIANMNTSRTADGGSYIPLRLLSGPIESFDKILADENSKSPKGVMVYGTETVNAGVRQSYEPSHPHANAEGYVTYPNVSYADEMTLMIKTTRSYEANLVAMAAARQIYSSALQLGRQS